MMRSIRLSIGSLAEKPGAENNSSDVMMRMIAMTASHRLRSEVDKGKNMASPKGT